MDLARKRSKAGILLGISLQRGGGHSYRRQLYGQLRDLILSGQLAPAQRLPSTRVLANEIGVSRNAVMAVFEQLQAEGYVTGIVGSGTRVTEILPEGLLYSYATTKKEVQREGPAATSRRSQTVDGLVGSRSTWSPSFSPGMPAIDQFPFATWAKLLAQEWKNPGLGALPSDPGGHWPLRENIANYVRTARGVTCEADQVIVVSGNREGTELAARVLLDADEAAIVEDPGYQGTRSALAAAGVRSIPLRVDADGFVLTEIAKEHRSARLLCTAPSHHYPLGGTMSLTRRLELLEWCRKQSCWIVEDDYDSEFRYSERPLPSLQSLDPNAKVIYVGTFSKTLFPSLRLGYLIVPKNLVQPFVKMKVATTGPTTMISQRAISRFIDDEHFYKHVRSMRKLYDSRRQALVQAVQRYLPGVIIPKQQNAGLFLVTFFSDELSGLSDLDVAAAARSLGVHVEPLSSLYMSNQARHGLIFGFGGLDEAEMLAPILRLASVLSPGIKGSIDAA